MKSLTVGQAALRLGVSSQRVRQLVLEGRLPARRSEWGWRLIDAVAVERLAEQREKARQSHGRPT